MDYWFLLALGLVWSIPKVVTCAIRFACSFRWASLWSLLIYFFSWLLFCLFLCCFPLLLPQIAHDRFLTGVTLNRISSPSFLLCLCTALIVSGHLIWLSIPSINGLCMSISNKSYMSYYQLLMCRWATITFCWKLCMCGQYVNSSNTIM